MVKSLESKTIHIYFGGPLQDYKTIQKYFGGPLQDNRCLKEIGIRFNKLHSLGTVNFKHKYS
jgi:hypothetical protein